jgi:hypothetical protein
MSDSLRLDPRKERKNSLKYRQANDPRESLLQQVNCKNMNVFNFFSNAESL